MFQARPRGGSTRGTPVRGMTKKGDPQNPPIPDMLGRLRCPECEDEVFRVKDVDKVRCYGCGREWDNLEGALGRHRAPGE